MADLLDRNFLFVAGKGGVGKTTVSAALGLAAARKGKKTLIAMTNAKERLSTLLGTPPIGDQVVTVAPNLDAVNMTPQAALEEYGMMILKVRALYNAVFENRFVRSFLKGTPGIEAWSMLGKAFFHADPPSGPPDYDLVIVDAPATGHAIDMLQVPQVIVDVAPPGLLRKEAERALALFRDERRAGVVLVTLPEDMPTNETLELHDAIRTQLRLPIATLVVNSVLPSLFRAKERPVFSALEVDPESPLRGLALAARSRATRETVQRVALTTLSRRLPDLPRVELPHLFTPEFGRPAIESLSRGF